MNELLDDIYTLVANVMPGKVQSLAEAIKRCQGSSDTAAVKDWPNNQQLREHLLQLLKAWKETSVSSDELAGILIGASHAYDRAKAEESTELVWTGPSSQLMSTRRTEQALLEVIQFSKKSLFIVSFVAYEVASVTKALNEALDRDVRVSILMEPAEHHGGHAKGDCFASMRDAVPGAKLYAWSDKSKSDEGGGYRLVHAKCSVADGKIAFISSANLTSAALERNMELGVLIKGKDLPGRLQNHLESLVKTNIIVRV